MTTRQEPYVQVPGTVVRDALGTLGRLIFTLWFLGVMLLFSALAMPVLAVFISLCHLLTLSLRTALRRFRRAISWYGRVIISVLPWPFIRVRYTDLQPETPERAYVVVANHPSASDPYLMAFLPWECVQVAKAWPFRLPVLGRLARCAGYLSVTELSIEDFVARGTALLEAGTSVIAFPEGTRSGAGPVGAFHGAIFRLANEARVPIVPMSITGNEQMPPRGSLLMRPGRVQVTKMPCLEWDDYRSLAPFALKEKVRALIVEQMERDRA